MTREEAIDIIKCLAWHTRPTEEMIEQAIKELEQESTVRNCFGCKYAKDNHNAGTEECHLCMWENQYKPTAKNDLGVDCISRQAVIDLLFNSYIKTELTSIGDASKEYAELCVDELKELPSVNSQESSWIPVTERLPKDKQRVLVTRKSGTIGYITWNTWWHEQMNYPTDKVIAWMPLPEPYKENKE